MKPFYCLALMLIPAISNAQTSNTYIKTDTSANTLLWQISGNGLAQPSYIFGTFHLLCKEDILFSDALKMAIGNSQEVYLELDMDDPATLLGALTLMNMKDGKKLKDLYTADQYERIADYFKDSLKTPLSMFQRMKPEFLMALIYPKMMPCSAATSVEEVVMQFAKKAGKEVNGLETMAFQASVLDSIPYEEQAAELLNAIDSMEKSKTQFGIMLAAYKNQRLDEMEAMMHNPGFGVADNLDVLLNNRNKNWVLQLKAIMKKMPVFIAVGAGHLVGKNGLIALLKAEGYVVRGVLNK